MVIIRNRQKKIVVDIDLLTALAEKMIKALKYEDFDLGILLTTNRSIRIFNRDYRHKDKPTDILSFPYHPALRPGERINPVTQDDKNLGDIIISLEYVQHKAPEWGRSFQEHLVALLAHGIAHLLNYDHQTDEEFAQMQKVEKKLLKAVHGMY